MFELLAQTTTTGVGTDGLSGPAWVVVAIMALKVALEAVTKLLAKQSAPAAVAPETKTVTAVPVDPERCQEHGEAIAVLQEQYRQLIEVQRSIDRRLERIEKALLGERGT